MFIWYSACDGRSEPFDFNPLEQCIRTYDTTDSILMVPPIGWDVE